MAATRNITIYQGDTYIHELRIKNNSNVAINISTRTYNGAIRKKRNSDTVAANFSSEITDGANGVVVMSLTASNTANIAAGTYVYDFQETNGQTITTLLTGNVTVTGEVYK
jgi:Na+-translocating ferredoxin:NAD+ oxidoreductase RnfG subunit